MTLELISEISGRAYRVSATAFGKVLHLSRQHGWQSESRDAGMVLSQLERYMSGRFSRNDAEGLRVALTRATATGAVAAERALDFAAATLLEVSRRGAFQIRTVESDAEDFSTSVRQPAFALE